MDKLTELKRIEKLFSPKSIAIVGASESRHYSQSIISNLRLQGFSDSHIYPINPKYEVVSGIKCYASIDDLPEVPDVVALLVGREHVSAAVDSAGKLGVGAVLVLADGYADVSDEGHRAQIELRNQVNGYNMEMLGPNTLGYVVPATNAGLWCAGTLPSQLRSGGISVVAQSSGMLNVIMGMLGGRQIGVRASVSIGNAAAMGLPELVSFFAEDPQTNVIALVVESIDRPGEFADALVSAQRNGKPVIVLKIGASARGQQNSVAHTGRLSSPGQAWHSLFRKVGACEAYDIDDFIETLTLFEALGKDELLLSRKGSELGVAFATISGGETSLMCDIAEQEGLELARLSDDTLSSLRLSLNKSTLIGNPLDLQNSRTSRPDAFWESIEKVVNDDSVDLLAIRFNLPAKPTTSLASFYQEVVDFIRSRGVVPVVLSRSYERLDESWWTLFNDLNVSFVMSYRNAIKALTRYNLWNVGANNVIGAVPSIPRETGQSENGDSVSLSLDRAREWLLKAGVNYVPSEIAVDPQGAGELANQIGYPVVVKALLPNMVHKSDSGGVVLDLRNEESVVRACKEMGQLLSNQSIGQNEQLRFEVQKMMGTGVEVILGMKRDPTWGPLIMIGAGGIYAEILRDTVWDLPVGSSEEAISMLQRLRIWPILSGARGQDAVDIEALSRMILSFSEALVRDGSWIESMDLNPVIVGPTGSGAFAVDIAMFVDETVSVGEPMGES